MKDYLKRRKVFTMKRLFDLTVSLSAVLILMIPITLVAIIVKLTSPGPVLYWSNRVGKNKVIFKMPKFRTMQVGTTEVATHLLANQSSFLTTIGGFLRKSSLDELPQLWNIIKGDMSLVGPRPALFNQDDLISLRTESGVHNLLPGLTCWAQINGRYELPIPEKVKLDLEYMQKQSLLFDFVILWRTFIKVIARDGISH